MKKQLLAGTALVAAAMFAAGGATAQDKMKKKMMTPSISVNGSFESVVGGILDDNLKTKFSYRAVDADGDDSADGFGSGAAAVPGNRNDKTDTSAVDTRSDAEIHFNGRAVLDNGLKIHARVELEGGNSSSDPVDEHFLSLSGSFGNIILGGTGGAPVRMVGSMSGSFATGVGESLAFDLDGWAGTASGGSATFYQLRHVRLDTGDAEKITYISPNFGGFQVGMTYSPERDNNDGTGRVDAEANVHDGLEAAVTFAGKFGEVGFGMGAGLTSYKGGTDGASQDLSDWAVAGRLDFGGGFRVSAAYKQVSDDDKTRHSSIIDGGMRYVAGANRFSVTGSYGEMETGEANHTSLMGSYARALGTGVTMHVNLAWTESQGNVTATGDLYNEDGTAAAVATVTNRDHVAQYGQKEQSAVVFITGIKVVF